MQEIYVYKTSKGSSVDFIDKHPSCIEFDWFEEDQACDSCQPCFDETTKRKLVWTCDYCDGGLAPLEKIRIK